MALGYLVDLPEHGERHGLGPREEFNTGVRALRNIKKDAGAVKSFGVKLEGDPEEHTCIALAHNNSRESMVCSEERIERLRVAMDLEPGTRPQWYRVTFA